MTLRSDTLRNRIKMFEELAEEATAELGIEIVREHLGLPDGCPVVGAQVTFKGEVRRVERVERVARPDVKLIDAGWVRLSDLELAR